MLEISNDLQVNQPTVTTIGNTPFSYCTDLENIIVSSENPIYKSTNNCLIEIATYTLIAGANNGILPSDGSSGC